MFTYAGDNRALLGFFNAIELIMETGFAVTAFLALILNLIIPEEDGDDDIPELTAADLDDDADKAEWDQIRRKSAAADHSSEGSRGIEVGDLEKREAGPTDKVSAV